MIYKIRSFFFSFYLFMFLFICVLRSVIEGVKSNSMLKSNRFKQFCEKSITGCEFW